MAYTPCAGSLAVCRMRVARLGADGVPLPGSGNLYVSSSLVRLQITPEITEGSDFEQANGCGDICVSYKDCDRLKRLNLSMELCIPDPALIEMLVGGTVLTSGGETRGYSYPRVNLTACPYGVSIEAWTKAIVSGAQANERPYWRWVLPRTKWQIGERTLENAIMGSPLTGFAEENANFYNGPANDISYTTDTVAMYFRDLLSAVPNAACGSSSLIAS